MPKNRFPGTFAQFLGPWLVLINYRRAAYCAACQQATCDK